MMMAENKVDQAASLMTNVRQNLDIMLKPDRMKNYPDDLRQWVQNLKPEVAKMTAELKEKRRH